MTSHEVKGGAAGGLDALRVRTVNHRGSGWSAVAAVSAGAHQALAMHDALAAHGIESVEFTTCHRTELYWRSTAPSSDAIADAVFAAIAQLPLDRMLEQSTRAAGEAAARHLFRVCCGLESAVVGEAEVLGQARAALDSSSFAGSFLTGVFRGAIRAGRAARAETAIGTGALSVASTAMHWLAGQVDPAGARIVLVGAGDTVQKAGRHLRDIGAGSLVVLNRTVERAHHVAAAIGASAAGLDDLPSELLQADAVVSAVRAPSWVITLEHLRARRRARPAPLVVVDLSMPASIEPGHCDGVARVDLAGVEQLAADHRARREAEAPQVEAVIDRELDWLRDWARHEMLRPIVSTLRQKVDMIRRDELKRAQDELRHAADANAVLERFSKRLFDRMLALPLDRLKMGRLPLDGASTDYLRRLFALDEGPAS